MSTNHLLQPRTITALAEYVGDYPTLALILNVTVQDLNRWAAGLGCPPVHVALRLTELTQSTGQQDRAGVQKNFSGSKTLCARSTGAPKGDA